MKSNGAMASDYSAILTDEDRAKGFFVASHSNTVMLLRWSKPIASFSKAISVETMRAMVELIKACEETGRAQSRRGAVG
jgi:hypothetical protein